MRHRVAEFLKILNRAKPEQAEKERKTARYVVILQSDVVVILTLILSSVSLTVDVHSDGLKTVNRIHDIKGYIDVKRDYWLFCWWGRVEKDARCSFYLKLCSLLASAKHLSVCCFLSLETLFLESSYLIFFFDDCGIARSVFQSIF